jgi:hypothetical protein
MMYRSDFRPTTKPRASPTLRTNSSSLFLRFVIVAARLAASRRVAPPLSDVSQSDKLGRGVEIGGCVRKGSIPPKLGARTSSCEEAETRACTHKSRLFGNRWLPQNDVCGLRLMLRLVHGA